PTIDISLFKNRAFSAGCGVIAVTFFALMGATFYLAYFMQAVRGYTPLAAGVALIAVAGAVMIMSPLSAKLAGRFGPNRVSGAGMLLFGAAMCGYALVGQHTGQWAIEVLMVLMGSGMGLVMGPSTNAVMGAVPREKAGAGSSVNNTVRQTAGALGVAILGSILAVTYRGHLGDSSATTLAGRLDQPTAVVSTLPRSQQVGPLVAKDTTESIGASLEFITRAEASLKARAAAGGSSLTPQQLAAQQATARTELTGYVQSSQDSFVSAMHFTSLIAGIIAVIGAFIAFMFLPSRRRQADVVDQAREPSKQESQAVEMA
ncbi:MAG: Drug resistance transporter, EmrB/QacA subfamily, partial [Pseudonocardiales bacterium]|nr:Drug resistance transporter, EmrB/QacA subfamily [Pseudonocardiales bacterium]